MFSLIITIISIALVVSLVAATMYYGGSALNQGTEKADAAAFVSGAQQITGAVSLFKSLEGSHPNEAGAADTEVPLTVAALTSTEGEKYLSALPVAKGADGWQLVETDKVVHKVASKAVCEQLKKNGGSLYTCAGTGADADSVGTAPFKFTFNY